MAQRPIDERHRNSSVTQQVPQRRGRTRRVGPPDQPRRPPWHADLAVIVRRADVGSCPAGVLGVDLFFVLSGFRITGLLLSEQHRAGGLRLGSFWARRIRRLVPAVPLVALAMNPPRLSLPVIHNDER